MKRFSILPILCFISANAFAHNETPIPGVEYQSTDSPTLSVQNLSSDEVTIDIYGKTFTLANGSGLSFECESQTYVEILVKDIVHDYFEVSCPSKVTFTADFILNNKES